MPGRKRGLKLNSGYGSAKLSVNLADGMITSVNQDTDTKIPETISAITGFAKLFEAKPLAEDGKAPACTARAALFPIVDGQVDTGSPIPLRF